MNLIDSHCHLHLLDLDKAQLSLDDLIKNAKQNHVSNVLCVSVEWSEFETIKNLALQYPDFIYISTGLHPSYAQNKILTIEDFGQRIKDKFVIAFGETGLDYGHEVTSQQKEIQQQNFITHIKASKIFKKSLIIHTRYANEDTLSILSAEHTSELAGVMHCFTESWEMAKKCLDINMYISFSGIITFKNADNLRDVVRKMPIDRILIETDSPYLAPVPFRGKQNQPAWVKYVAETIAELKNTSVEFIAEITKQNFDNCFKIVR